MKIVVGADGDVAMMRAVLLSKLPFRCMENAHLHIPTARPGPCDTLYLALRAGFTWCIRRSAMYNVRTAAAAAPHSKMQHKLRGRQVADVEAGVVSRAYIVGVKRGVADSMRNGWRFWLRTRTDHLKLQAET